MGGDAAITGTADITLVRLGDRYVSVEAAQLHIFGVLLGAHLGSVGTVPNVDLDTLPSEVTEHVRELTAAGIWWHVEDGYRIDPGHAARTMRESLERLNDPDRCVATGSSHVRGADSFCTRCGALRD